MKKTITSVVLSMSLALLSGGAAAALRPAAGAGSGEDAVARVPVAEIALGPMVAVADKPGVTPAPSVHLRSEQGLSLEQDGSCIP